MRDLEHLAQRAYLTGRQATVDYQPAPNSFTSNKAQAVYSFAAVGVLSFIPGPGIASGLCAVYGGVKAYQAIRDWAGK